MKTKIQFKKDPICEVCGDDTAMSFSHFEGEGWKFCCMCTSESEGYYIEFNRFFKDQRSTVDWLAHMHEKNWMDWRDFMDMMHRFRKATDSYNSIA